MTSCWKEIKQALFEVKTTQNNFKKFEFLTIWLIPNSTNKSNN